MNRFAVIVAVALGLWAGSARGEQGEQTEPGARDPLPSVALQQLADQLNARERALDRREADLELRASDLEELEERVSSRIGELTEAREALIEKLEIADAETEARVNGVVKMFESMRSKNAAAVMGELPSGEAVLVLDRMNRTKAGKLLAAMPAGGAAALAEQMVQPIDVEAL